MKSMWPRYPKCHFKEMTLHTSDSDDSGRSDGFQCDHCGHTVMLLDWMDGLKEETRKEKERGTL